jgi:hypothetical protein
MVHKLRLATWQCNMARVAGQVTMVVWCLGQAAMALAQEPPVHYLHHGAMPPGAIGSRQLQRGGPLPGFFQPVEIKAPGGALVSLAIASQFDAPQAAPRRVGFLIGSVYRLRVTNIPGAEGLEIFPTIEVIDRIYAPPDQQIRFAIPIELAQLDLELAIGGKFVTRVIYLENPLGAVPVRSDPKSQSWFEVGPKADPLAVADTLGRPVAILRMGGRLPDQVPDPVFFFGSPPFCQYPPRPAMPPRMEVVPRGKPEPAAVVPPAAGGPGQAPEEPQP